MTLVDLPIRAKISLALNCWTSPNNLSFIAVTGYYIDQDWKYKKALLGFEPLTEVHTGKHLATILTWVLEHHSITNQVFSLTTNNTSNNTTLATALEDTIPAWKSDMIYLLYLAHVI